MKTLADIADDDGTFAIIAMDQRNTLRRMFDAVGEEATAVSLGPSRPHSLSVRPTSCCTSARSSLPQGWTLCCHFSAMQFRSLSN